MRTGGGFKVKGQAGQAECGPGSAWVRICDIEVHGIIKPERWRIVDWPQGQHAHKSARVYGIVSTFHRAVSRVSRRNFAKCKSGRRKPNAHTPICRVRTVINQFRVACARLHKDK